MARVRRKTGRFKTPLTDKEREVLCLLALPDVDIAYRLYRSLEAVRQSKKFIFKKLKVHSRTEAIIMAIRRGIVDIWEFTLSKDEY